MAELYTFNAAGDTLKHKRLMGNFHVRPWCGPENLFDGNVLSFYDSTTCTAYGTDGNWNSRKTCTYRIPGRVTE